MKEKNGESKPKKEKIIYIDDGSTIADMTGVGRGKKSSVEGSDNAARNGAAQPKKKVASAPVRIRPTFGECFKTYIESVKMMFLPMLVTLGIISVAFLLLWLMAK
ncbi:MAG: hypothetical protein IJY04_05730 [Clostridia bacterium]|nr:hypothetical protein [Clostridia bacterium]